jgi:adenine specific DNA methylase Mod
VSKKTEELEPENQEFGKPGSQFRFRFGKTKNQVLRFQYPVFGFPVFTGLNIYIIYFFLCGQPYIWEIFARSEIGVGEHLVYVGILFLFDEDLIEKTKIEPRYVKASSLNKFGIGFLISRWMLWLKT